ncbi:MULTISPECIES: hypothetical protein [Methylobacterium]|uniref:PepSY domain-containing protein n=1 Tax=Methylobacterium isbiliense TaxID=315478 RepID=A0ABQ4S8C1_9HYPH|nr:MULTISPECIES: hypothetical protein [Methylobacterium]MBY0297655.1 hypothetical protein [Methylobacterium sp.]MDN3625749.1 hypothetical protein [Methylobacterium isbiliense]GJD98728.1 hypothetical protein GMJLKIPL_0639 [Methylobacterium isbiliense]
MMPRLALLALGAMLAAGPAQADHHLLKRALQQAGCIARSTSLIQRDGPRTVYDVTCLGSTPDRVIVVCTGRICLPDDPRHHGAEDEMP